MKLKRIYLLGALALLLIGAGLAAYWLRPAPEPLHTVTEAALRDVIDISELSTVNYTYNSVATSYADDGVTPRYHVAYEGTVRAGIDFSQVSASVNDQTIVITVPPVTLQEVTVDMGTMEFLFVKSRYQTETVSEEAYHLCCDDLRDKAAHADAMWESARQGAEDVLRALYVPWLEQEFPDFTISFEWEGMQ